MKRYLVFLPFLLLFSLVFSSCEYLFPEIISEDCITISGQSVVYAGSTARLTYSIYAPNYENRTVSLKVYSSNDSCGEAYFTSSCKNTNEFIIEGVSIGKFTVRMYIQEIPNISGSYEITVVDSSSLSFSENRKEMEKGDSLQLNVINPQDLRLNFSSSNEEVASVDSTGRVNAKKSGVAGITVTSQDGLLTSTCIITVKTNVKADKFFWGEWISMFDGSVMVIEGGDVILYPKGDSERKKGTSYEVDSSGANQITLSNGDTYVKSTQNVIEKDNIPYFRNGGTNLSYKLKLVGFVKEEPLTTARASTVTDLIQTETLGGIQVTGKSNSFTGYEDSAESDENGIVVLSAPVSGDTQTVTITTDDGTTLIIPELKIDTDGESMGTVPVVKKGDYSLKVTGKIEEKTDGYLYAGETYKMKLTITNVSEVKSGAGSLKIQSSDSSVSVSSSSYDLEGITLSTMLPGASKTVEVWVSCNSISDAFVDSGLDVTITNSKTASSPAREWNDFVPVRFFRDKVPVTVSAKSAESNGSCLHCFMIYPDGNSAFFEVKDGMYQTVYIPSYGNSKRYKLAFCGASADVIMSNTTEMFYSVNINSENPAEVVTSGSELSSIIGFGEGNETEDNPYNVTDSSFEGYAAEGDKDFYSFSVN